MGQVITLQVAGMDCAACERRLETVLGRLGGVGALAAAASERIGQAGFTVTGRPQARDGEAARP